MISVLIIDDDQSMCKLLSQIVINCDGLPQQAVTIAEGLRLLEKEWFDLVFLDVTLPDGNGLDYIPRIKTSPSAPEVIIITGRGESEGARMAINGGAWDYIDKPFSNDRIRLQINSVSRFRADIKPIDGPSTLKRDSIIGHSAALKRSLTILEDVSRSDANVLIMGETGTGKELFAKAIHQNSDRSRKKFVVVDCGSLTESLVGSILFGHLKGAFTGADKAREGLIALADGGTLFLDEIGELPATIQSAFLRVIQERKIRPLGSAKELDVDFRLIAATSRNPDGLVDKGHMRKDLLFRLKTMTIELPPLRERQDDIDELTTYYTKKYCVAYGLKVKEISEEMMAMMRAYAWPGNIRELGNAVEKAVCSARSSNRLYPIHLPSSIRVQSVNESRTLNHSEDKAEIPTIQIIPDQDSFQDLKSHVRQCERQYLSDLIRVTNGDVSEMTRISKLSKSSIYDRLKSFDLRLK